MSKTFHQKVDFFNRVSLHEELKNTTKTFAKTEPANQAGYILY
jgi:hypothetical protein